MDQPQQQQQPQHLPTSFVTVPPPTVAYHAASDPPLRPRYKQAAGRATGYIQIFCGLASMVLGVCVLLALFGIIHDPQLHLGHVIFGIISWPIWSGLVYLISGSLGAATKAGSSCLITGYMVMSIISAIIAAGQLIWESIAAAVTKCYDYNHDDYYMSYSNDCDEPMVSYGMHVSAVVVAILELIAAITGSAFCCHGACCNVQPTQAVVQHVQYSTYPPNTVVTQAPRMDSGSFPMASAPVLLPPAPEYTPYPPDYSANLDDYNATMQDHTTMDTGLPGKPGK